MVLQDDVPAALFAESGDRLVFAGGQQRIHPRGAKLELDDLLPVEPVLAVVAAEYDARAVPLAHGAQQGRSMLRPYIRCDEIVQRGRAVGRELAVLVAVVVENLVLEAERGVGRPSLSACAALG